MARRRVDSAADAGAAAPASPRSHRRHTAPPAPAVARAARKRQASPGDTSTGPSDDEIRERAYRRYLERGGGHGKDWDDWLAAERELRHR